MALQSWFIDLLESEIAPLGSGTGFYPGKRWGSPRKNSGSKPMTLSKWLMSLRGACDEAISVFSIVSIAIKLMA